MGACRSVFPDRTSSSSLQLEALERGEPPPEEALAAAADDDDEVDGEEAAEAAGKAGDGDGGSEAAGLEQKLEAASISSEAYPIAAVEAA